MGHKTLIEGAAFNVAGGRTLIGGAGFNISKGRTLIGGAGYDIPFYKPSFDEVIADMEILNARGRSSTSAANIYASVPMAESGTVYAIQFINGNLAIAKAEVEVTAGIPSIISTETLLATSANRIVGFDTSQTNVIARASYDGTTSDQIYVYGGTIALVRFPSFLPSQVDEAVKAVASQKLAGRDNSTAATISASYDAAGRWFAAFNTDNSTGAHIAYSSPLGTVIFSTDQTNPSLLWQSGTSMYLSQNGTTAASLRGGSIVAVTE